MQQVNRDDKGWLGEEMQEPMSMKYSYMPYMDESERLYFDNPNGGYTEKAEIHAKSLALDNISQSQVEDRSKSMNANKDRRANLQRQRVAEYERGTDANPDMIDSMEREMARLADEYSEL